MGNGALAIGPKLPRPVLNSTRCMARLLDRTRFRAGTAWQTHAKDSGVDSQEKGRMVSGARELPTTGYALEVDGRLKTQFETKEEPGRALRSLKGAFRCCGSKSMTQLQRPGRKSIFDEVRYYRTRIHMMPAQWIAPRGAGSKTMFP